MSEPRTIPPALAAMKPTLQQMYAMVGLAKVRAVRHDVTVPAGFFEFDRHSVDEFIQEELSPRERDEVRADWDILNLAVARLRETWRKVERIGQAEGETLALRPPPLGRWSHKDIPLAAVYGPVMRQRCQVDVTWNERRDGRARKRQIARWEDNSCAYDVVLALLLLMDAGVLQYDQPLFPRAGAPEFRPNIFWDVAKIPWERISDIKGPTGRAKQLARFRDRCRREYVAHHNDTVTHENRKRELDDFMEVAEVLEYALRNLPQCTWHHVDTRMCDTCGIVPTDAIRYQSGSSIALVREHVTLILSAQLDDWVPKEADAETFLGRLRAAFGYHSPVSKTQPCSEPHCEGRVYRVWVVGGDLPPRFWVEPGDDIPCFKESTFDFADFELSFFRLGPNGYCEDCTVPWRARAFVIAHGSHFYIHWRENEKEWVKYDAYDREKMISDPRDLAGILAQLSSDAKRGLGVWAERLKKAEEEGDKKKISDAKLDLSSIPIVKLLLLERRDCFDL